MSVAFITSYNPLSDLISIYLLPYRYALRSQASIVITDRDLRIVHVNTSWVNSTGYSATQCNGQFLPSLFYDGKGRSSNSGNSGSGGGGGASNGGYHLKGCNSLWRAKSNNDIMKGTTDDMMHSSSRPFGATSSSVSSMSPDNNEVISQLKLFRRLIRRIKRTKKQQKKPRCMSELAEENDMNIHPIAADRKFEPSQTQSSSLSKHSESFGGVGSGVGSGGGGCNSNGVNNSNHGQNYNVFRSNHGSLVNEETWNDENDDSDEDEINDDVITANVTGNGHLILSYLVMFFFSDLFNTSFIPHPPTHPPTHPPQPIHSLTHPPTHSPTPTHPLTD